jgi:hypothetical protein
MANLYPPLTAPTLDETNAYAGVAEIVRGSYSDQNPPEVQISRVSSASGGNLGFLLESPEPIDWSRSTFFLSHSSSQVGDSDLSDGIKICEVGIHATNVQQEQVSLLLDRQMNLTGYQLEYYDGTDWQPFFTFGDEEPMLTGTMITIESCAGTSTTDNLREIRFANRTSPMLSGNVVCLRLVDANGVAGHRKEVLSANSFSDVSSDVRVLRKEDGTGMMLYIDNMQQGTYRLMMWYFLDNTVQEPDSPVFKFNGNSNAEMALIDIPWDVVNPPPRTFIGTPIQVGNLPSIGGGP